MQRLNLKKIKVDNKKKSKGIIDKKIIPLENFERLSNKFKYYGKY